MSGPRRTRGERSVRRALVRLGEQPTEHDGVAAPGPARRIADPDLPIAQRLAILSWVGRAAGNRAAAELIGQQPPTVQRWSSSEHVRLGDVIDRPIPVGGGVSLSYGQIVALAGDEFGTLEDLMDATKSETGRAMIRAHLERAKIAGTAGALLPAPSTGPDGQVSKASTEYITLAMNNTPHFAGGGTAVRTWLEKHAEAVDLALQSGFFQDEALLDRAFFTEAFGDHFLTDAFSSGHIRVPRQEIEAYYSQEFAPAVFDHVLDHLRDRLIDEVYDQVEQQTALNEVAWVGGGLLGGLGARALFRRQIRAAINERLNAGFTAGDGRAEMVRQFGQLLAGVVCGAMHDEENRNGLQVVSDMDATPWTAYGDSDLDRNPQHREYAMEAVRTAVADLERARDIGVQESQEVYNVVSPDVVPGTVYFGFDQDTLTPLATSEVETVAQFLRYNPSTLVSLVGHADPLGEAPYNQDLGTRRAERVAQALITHGVQVDRISVDSLGESAPVAPDKASYHLDRRVTVSYATGVEHAEEGPDDVGLARARQVALDAIGPPYAAEEHFPRPADSGNQELPAWRWGDLSPAFQAEMDKWLTHYIREYAEDALKNKALDDDTVDTAIGDFTVSPRPIARRIIDEILVNPVGFLSATFGRAAGR